MKTITTLLLLISAVPCIAQRQNVYLLKNDGRYVTVEDSADIVRIVSEPDSGSALYNVAEYYKKSGKRKLVAKSSTIDPPKFEGMVMTSYENGNRKAINKYAAGVFSGEQYEFFPNGKLYVIKTYNDKPNKNNFPSFSITANYDSLGNVLVTDGNGYLKEYNDSFNRITREGSLKGGKRNGEWKFRDSLISAVEIYSDGAFVSGTSTDKDGKVIIYTVPETTPTFRGGPLEFSKYLATTVRYPDIDRRNAIQGTVLISFVVEKDGKTSNIKVLRPVSPSIDREAVRVIEKSPLWQPGTQFGRTVRAQYTVPITFSLGY